ncbi:protein jagged-2-like [Rhinatrema bivittatum]|uniref:protein jagged-2-like n=1 Tax=Rhinatrema bivittatum TaxID=194408 RepID=UPI00112BCE34|nr:protein jagged-2-like [Rhinatrema bivittatum]
MQTMRRKELLPVTLLLPLLLLQPQVFEAAGHVEVQIKFFQNIRGTLASGQCCDGDPGHINPPCPQDECDTYFRVCLKEYQLRVVPGGPCVMGTGVTPVLGGNAFSIKHRRGGDSMGRILIPFQYAWPKSYSLILEAWDLDNGTASDPGDGLLIEQVTHSGMLSPGEHWQSFRSDGRGTLMEYKIRVRCDENYYGPSCNKLCRHRDDYFGHYSCDVSGNKVCLNGWTGPECKEATCRQGCHETHGFCKVPGECRCHYGWKGQNCDECIPFPGCVHGTCFEPWKCVCDTNWGGLLCDKDLNSCGSLQPCQNGGTCTNTEPDQYECLCPGGFYGRNCEKYEFSCPSSPCLNGGTCLETNSGFRCLCAPGWAGELCKAEIAECASQPCAHGGTCHELLLGYSCVCPPEWTGKTCRLDVNECERAPCLHTRSCKNLIGSYFCDCQEGWSGPNCDTRSDLCHGRCQNGGKCQVLRDGYGCLCPPGYTGTWCETKHLDCTCQHGGRCRDVENSFHCDCPAGRAGPLCEFLVNVCDPNPCPQGAHCSEDRGSYRCSCLEGPEGRDCQSSRDSCAEGDCSGSLWSLYYMLVPLVLLTLAIFLCCFFLRWRQQRRQKSHTGNVAEQASNNLPDAIRLIHNATHAGEETQWNGGTDILFPGNKEDRLKLATPVSKIDISNKERAKLNEIRIPDCEGVKV